MTSHQLREKFLKFFEKNNHVIIPSASLIPSEGEQLAGKEKVLFTSAGMQPLITYLMGKPHPKGKKLADVQKCLRTDDIEEVGDHIHHTFFEMLGNWSLGDYWKDEAIRLSFEFLTKELEIPVEKLAISVFAGDEDAPRDEQSANKWKSLGVPEKRIAYLGKEANWWPTNPSSIGPCGPDTEMFVWTGKDLTPEEFDPKDSKWVEVWNDVFMQFNRKEDGSLEDLPQKNVDTGMGLERMLAVINGKDNDYETDLFIKAVRRLEEKSKSFNIKDARIVSDHIKAAIFLASEGVEPSNKEQGYVLRRLIRRSEARAAYGLQIASLPFADLLDIYIETYPELLDKKEEISRILKKEIGSFLKALEKAFKEFEKIKAKNPKFVPGKEIFYLHATHGLTFEIIADFAEAENLKLDKKGFEEEYKKHQEVSRVEKGKFAGGLADHSEVVIQYHTATHLLHQALRDTLGPQVFQKGSNITRERLRFDFSYDKKMTAEEIQEVENLVNERIKQDLKVDHMIIPLDQAKKMNAIGLFDEKYADKVSIYGIGPNFELDKGVLDQRDRGGYYSLEFCGGPHVEATGVIGKIKITKEEAVSAGVRRIKAEIMLR